MPNNTGTPAWWLAHPVAAALIALLAAALVAGGVAGGLAIRNARHSCASGVERKQGECVGVTDGSFSFLRPELDGVSSKIKSQNDWVRAQGRPYVTVAFARPMDSGDAGQGDRQGIQHSLEGAYAAQWRANHAQVDGDSPLIRLVVANFGDDQSAHWKTAAAKLVAATRGRDHLVAVVGLSRSTAATSAAMRYLSDHRIPMVSDVLTADRVPGTQTLARVAPTDRGEAKAAADYFGQRHIRDVQLVSDRNGKDAYVTDLAGGFRKAFTGSGGHLHDPQYGSYNSSLGSPANAFANLVANLCSSSTRAVYFAGRSPALQTFVEALGNRYDCAGRFTVVTGDDATLLRSDDEFDKALGSGVTLVYTALTHPAVWHSRKTQVSAAAAGFFTGHGKDTFSGMFPGAKLTDGQAVMAHDALLTAVFAIRPRQQQRARAPLPSPADVAQNLGGLNGRNEVPGASGYISLANGGYAENKAVPILRRRPGNRVELTDVESGGKEK